MSDFLSRLAERTLGLTQTLRPSLPGWFAPLQDGAPIDEPLVAPGNVQPSALNAPFERTPTAAPKRVERNAAPAAQPRPTALEGGPSSAAHAVITETTPAPVRAATMRDVRHSESEQPALLQARRPAEREPPHPPASPPRSRPVAMPGAFEPLVRAAASRAAPFPPRAVIEAASQVRRDAAPSIRVTIGRVEVRANLVSETAAKPLPRRAPEPGLSLADYLKRGAGGGR